MHLKWLVVLSFCSTLASGADHGSPGGGGAHPRGESADAAVAAIFKDKCQSCHEGDGKFTDDNLPTEEWKSKILDSLNHKPGVLPMPKASAEQLTADEKRAINRWAGIDETPAQDVCSSPYRGTSLKVIQEIFSDRCVACHGGLSFNPSSAVRPLHQQFLKNDGTFDLTVLGDMSEIEAKDLPPDKTSLPRMIDALTGYTMPPRGQLPLVNWPSDSFFPQVGTPHLTVAERQALVAYLSDRVGREQCPVTSLTNPGAENTYAEAVALCEAAGMRIPTRKQADGVKSLVGKGCAWTSTFDADPSLPKRALRKIIRYSNGEPEVAWATENYKCQTFCVK